MQAPTKGPEKIFGRRLQLVATVSLRPFLPQARVDQETFAEPPFCVSLPAHTPLHADPLQKCGAVSLFSPDRMKIEISVTWSTTDQRRATTPVERAGVSPGTQRFQNLFGHSKVTSSGGLGFVTLSIVDATRHMIREC